MKLGIDFGTNRIVVAAADRGNYPLVSFEAPDSSSADWFPSLIAIRGEERRYGWEAWDAQADETWTVIRSIKRFLKDAGPQTLLEVGDQRLKLADLLHGFTTALFEALRHTSTLSSSWASGSPEIVLGVPAHANSNQRFLSVAAFRSAGFQVLGVLNEPSAASIEFGHRQRKSKASRETILVYDLGGGTFDASLVTLDEGVHRVIASEGIPTIGGDDFDEVLGDLALEAAGISQHDRDRISAAQWFRLLDECRRVKESLHSNSRRASVDLEHVNPKWAPVQVPVSKFYEAARPLVEETINATEDLMNRYPKDQFDALYVTGGGSELPLVARVLNERFGRRVRRSAYTRSATAIGLAIQADQPATYRLTERLTRFFGVWREADFGSRMVFDALFYKGMYLPHAGSAPLTVRRMYSPVHNVGYFRFLECSHGAADSTPTGEITLWDEIRFPFDPALETVKDLAAVPVTYSEAAAGQNIEELYECDSGGSIRVTICNESSGYRRTYQLGRWSAQSKTVKAGPKRKGASSSQGR